MQKITSKTIKPLYIPPTKSHKGQNGRLLIIAGSKKYHGSVVLAAQMASKIVDFVYVYTTPENFEIIKKMRSKLAEFIFVEKKELKQTLEKEVNAILIGPGLLPDKTTEKLVKNILKNYQEKKVILDAGALRTLDPKLLHKNCVITPHAQEFMHLFKDKKIIKLKDNAENKKLEIELKKLQPYLKGALVLKGNTDYIFYENKAYFNTTGNPGMTKGGTGDVLAGLLAGLLCKNDILTSTKKSLYVSGLAGDRLFKKYGVYYSASDLIPEIQKLLKN